ncbi:MAG TPA: class I SAM-dependent methyltransferase [Actinomycetota bacterium]|nr:class I SAM-dependent methyltransferase [Actinomycetota bacterium]
MSGSRLIAALKRGSHRDPWKRGEYRRLAAAVTPWVQSGSLVDVGCGEGLFTSFLAEPDSRTTTVVGMDIDSHPDWKMHGESVRFVVGDASRPPMPGGSAEVVLAKDLLHHAEDPAAAATWLVRMAKQRVIVIEANADNPIMAFYTRHNGDQHFTDARLTELLELACPGAEWQRSAVVSYPFYLPPVRTAAALWVWPVTLLMLLMFKVARSAAGANWLHGRLARLRWSEPFMVRVLDISPSKDARQ